jgi:tetratricopeptide (TPR) repeat protein
MVWKDSVTLWTDVLDKNPRCLEAYGNRAFIFNENKKYEEALKDLNAGLVIDPANVSFYKSKGIIFDHTGKYDLALANYSKALEYNPDEYKCYLMRGVLYTDKFAKYDSGIADFKKYLTRYPDDINALFNLGVANYNKRSYDTAKAYCLKVLKLNPGNEEALNLINNMEKLKP